MFFTITMGEKQQKPLSQPDGHKNPKEIRKMTQTFLLCPICEVLCLEKLSQAWGVPSISHQTCIKVFLEPGWLSWLSVCLRLRSWSHVPWVWAPHWTLCWQLRAWILLWILCLPLSLPLLCSWSVSLTLKNKKKNTKKLKEKIFLIVNLYILNV